jgi:DNA polymerase III sliding clamp (beta) subunit (PCNA family)
VSLATAPVDNFTVDFSNNLEPLDITVDDFVHSIKMTSFSCAPDFDEHPYTSILWFIEDGKINTQSSDKHRISVFGKKYELQPSYLISKTISDIILYYVEKVSGVVFSLYNSKLYLSWDGGELFCNLEKNTFEKIFSNFNQFFSNHFFLSLELEKDALIKSVKFVASIANSHMISLGLDINKLVISGNSNEQNAVIDTIDIENYEIFSVSYVSTHLIRVLDLLDSKKIKLNFIKHNDFILLMLEAENFKHILFPMD